MIFKLPSKTLPRLDGMIADASDSDGTPQLVLSFSVQDENGAEPSPAEVAEIRSLLEAWAEDGPFDDRGQKGSNLRDMSKGGGAPDDAGP
jgi:hypothetical protein